MCLTELVKFCHAGVRSFVSCSFVLEERLSGHLAWQQTTILCSHAPSLEREAFFGYVFSSHHEQYLILSLNSDFRSRDVATCLVSVLSSEILLVMDMACG